MYKENFFPFYQINTLFEFLNKIHSSCKSTAKI